MQAVFVVDGCFSRGVAKMNEKYEIFLVFSVLFTGVFLSFGNTPVLATLVFLGMLSFWCDVNKRTLTLKKVRIDK